MAQRVNMAAPTQSASALFLREPELRRGMELLYFGNSHIVRSIDRGLAAHGLGRAHHRAAAEEPDSRGRRRSDDKREGAVSVAELLAQAKKDK